MTRDSPKTTTSLPVLRSVTNPDLLVRPASPNTVHLTIRIRLAKSIRFVG